MSVASLFDWFRDLKADEEKVRQQLEELTVANVRVEEITSTEEEENSATLKRPLESETEQDEPKQKKPRLDITPDLVQGVYENALQVQAEKLKLYMLRVATEGINVISVNSTGDKKALPLLEKEGFHFKKLDGNRVQFVFQK